MRRRRKKLVDPRLQWRFNFALLCVAGGSVLLQSVALAIGLLRMADELPHDGPVVVARIGGVILVNLILMAVLVVPLAITVGTILTFRVAGPLYRFRTFLDEVVSGARPADCQIRESDELHDFCDLLNRATAPLRAAEGPRPTVVEAAEESGPAAKSRGASRRSA
jgi:hypothetical protein